MPYITQDKRETLQVQLSRVPDTAGELNYVISVLSYFYFKNRGDNYQAANDVIGALDGASKEFYRKVVAPYEDQKCFENGEVYFVPKTEPAKEES